MGRRYSKNFYAEETFVAGNLSRILLRFIPGYSKKWKKVGYADFPGSFYEAQEEMYFHSNDAIFESVFPNAYVKLAMGFTGNADSAIAIRKELLNRYTNRRTNAYIFLKALSQRFRVHFIPADGIDMTGYISPANRAAGYCVPPVWVALNRASDGIKGILAPCCLPFICALVAFKLLKRGIVLREPLRRQFDFGFDLQRFGLKVDRGLINGEFFLYDDGHFHPSRILHVVRTRLEDEEARTSIEKFGGPIAEFDRIKIPLSYLLRRIAFEFILKNTIRGFLSWKEHDRRTALFLPSLAVMKMTMEAEIFYLTYDVHVFIARDEYSPFHIVRTCVANHLGNCTVGFQWADYWDRGEGLSDFVFDGYGVSGEFYREYLAKTLQFTKRKEIIGANIYGSDAMYAMLMEGYLPEDYRTIRDRYTLVAITGSSIAPEISLTKEAMITFYRDALSVAHAHENVFCVLKPKTGDLREELEEMIKAYPRAKIEEKLHTYQFLPLTDVVICVGSSTIGLESLMLGKKVVFYDLTSYPGHLYAQYSPLLVAATREELEQRMDWILAGGKYLDENLLAEIRTRHGYAFDGRVRERFRNMCLQILLNLPRTG